MSGDPGRPERERSVGPTDRSEPPVRARPLFREEAWAHLQARPERQAMPGFALPGTAWAVRAVVVLLIVGLAGLWFVRVPTVVAGRAVVDPTPAGAHGEILLLLPATLAGRYRQGQSLTLTSDGSSVPVRLVVTAMELEPLSPSDQQDRFGAGFALAEPAMVVRAAPAGEAAGLAVSSTAPLGAVRLDLGSDRLVERLPLGDLVARAGGGIGG